MSSQQINEAALVNNTGGNVDLTIHGNVTIIAGREGTAFEIDQKIGHDHAAEVSPTQAPQSEIGGMPPQEAKHVRLCNAVNEQTLKTIMVSVTDDFKEENLNEPTFEVYPQIRRVNNFFKGGYENWEKAVVESSTPGSKKKIIRNQMRREIGFYYEEREDKAISNEAISKDLLVESIKRKKHLLVHEQNPVTAVVASAGSGKTTLLRRVAKETLDSCPIFKYEDKSAVKQSHLKMIHYIELKHMSHCQALKPSQFLFEGLYENESDEDEAYKWLLDHQSESIIFLDGLDQATWSITKSSQTNLKPFQKGSTSQIMYNLLSRKLLPHVKIVIASREFRISELPAEARPEDIISLVGLKREDAQRLFVGLIVSHGAEIWEKIKHLSPRLLNLLSIPVFLVLTAAVMSRDPDTPPPATITELYKRILTSLRRVEVIQEREKIMDIIKKLKAMAHQGMVEGRVVFHDSDLKQFDLSIEDARDLMIKVPGNTLLSRYLFEGDFVFFFCHQSLQEFLSASFVAEMEVSDFSLFNDNHLHESRWSVVRTFVSGVIHDDESSIELHEVPDRESKKRLFAESLKVQIEKCENGIELLATIYESNDNTIVENLFRLPKVADTRLGPDQAHMFGSLLARRRKEHTVDLWRCGINDEIIDIIFRGRNIQVGKLNLHGNPFTVNGLNSALGHLTSDLVIVEYGRLKEYRYVQLNWERISQIGWRSFVANSVLMLNKDDIIGIAGNVNGRFFKTALLPESEEKRLSLYDSEECHVGEVFQNICDLVTFFETDSNEIVIRKQIYAEPSDIHELTDLEMEGEIDEILLDCRFTENVDLSSIDSFIRKYEVLALDILVNDLTSVIPGNTLTEVGRDVNTEVKVYWGFNVSRPKDDASLITKTCRENQVDQLRLFIKYFTSFEDIKNIILHCKAKKITLVFECNAIQLRTRREDIANLAALCSIDVEVVNFVDVKGAWKVADERLKD